MKKKILINFLIILFIVLCPIRIYATNVNFKYIQENQKKLENIPELGCKAVFIAEPSTGKIIYEKNAHEKMYPASTTKILTALVTIENCKLSDTAIVSQNAIDMVPNGYSNANLKAGEEFTIKDLLYALLVPSANEAANVLAEHISGSIEAFAELCNSRAKELGCENLHFINANGMHNEDHYCTAYDLYLIAKECRKYNIFNEIVKTKAYTLPSTSIYSLERKLKNTNELLLPGTYYYSYCTGIKTGHTTPAGECLVASSSYNNMELISVVLGGKSINSLGLNDRFYDTKRLFEFAYDNYSINTIAEHGDIVATVNVGKATKDTANLNVIVDSDISTIIPNDISKENLTKSISIKDEIVAPIKQNQVLGQVTYYADGLVYTTNIIADHSVEKLPYMLYNMIVAIALILIFSIYAVILKVFKKHKTIVIIIEVLILIGACVVLIPFVKKDIDNSASRIIPAKNVTIENQVDIEYLKYTATK
ncbi:MAG: D-alanyl-D-alanine carboxypeptidase [Clostridia bacterium]|nr:D-alanyl-D-alanine carboxypeptidase [Clostridia bacterium]